MNEFSNIIQVIPVFGNMRLDSYLFHADAFSIAPVKSEGSGGIKFDYSTEVVIDKPDFITIQEFSQVRSVVIAVKDSRGSTHYFGNNEIPARVSITSFLQKCRLKIECISLQPIL
ncbi:MAG: hypothetical protein ACRCZZ_07865 [Phocaeicola sp.]